MVGWLVGGGHSVLVVSTAESQCDMKMKTKISYPTLVLYCASTVSICSFAPVIGEGLLFSITMYVWFYNWH